TTPVPLRLIDCGLPLPLSVMLSAAPRLPVAVGVNVTLMLQLAFTARVAGLTGQLLVWAKSPELVPAMPILLIVSAPGPLLVKVTFCAVLAVFTVWLPKLRLAVDRPTTGATPVPPKLTACGVPGPLSLIARLATRLPDAVGEKATLILQEI